MATEGSALVSRKGPLSDAIAANKAHFLSSISTTGPHDMANSIGRDFDNNRARISDRVYREMEDQRFVVFQLCDWSHYRLWRSDAKTSRVAISRRGDWPCRYWVDRPHSCD